MMLCMEQKILVYQTKEIIRILVLLALDHNIITIDITNQTKTIQKRENKKQLKNKSCFFNKLIQNK